jgi:tetratricopeptide (TPR) repeat protein
VLSRRLRRAGWTACLVLVVVLLLGAVKPGVESVRQAMGVRGLEQAGAEIHIDEPNNPFICWRKAGNSKLAEASLVNLIDDYLRGVGLCIAGDYQAGLEAFGKAGRDSNADVHTAIGLISLDAQTRVDDVVKLGFSKNELVRVMQNLSTQPGIEPYPALRSLRQIANTDRATWTLWLQGSSQLEAKKEWQAALNWIDEGVAIAPPEVLSNLYMRAGQIHGMLSNMEDYHTTLTYYNQALETGGWINPDDEATALLLRGRLYRDLKEEYGLEPALQDFSSILKLQPSNYWALLEIGHTYLNDLKDLDKAESYYRQALAANEDYPYAYFYLGEVYRMRGEDTTAADWYRLTLKRQPDWQAAIDFLKTFEETK